MTTSTKFGQPAILGIVVPCYNEQEVLPETNARLLQVLDDLVKRGEIHSSSFICYVDDGSADDTWTIISDATEQEQRLRGIRLSTNFGHQNALLAGMMTFRRQADCIVTIDADLQDDLEVIGMMIRRHAEGHMVVYGARDNRESDTFFKRFTAGMFYRLMRKVNARMVEHHADFRLADRRVLNELARHREVNLFLRGLFPLMGFKSTVIYYSRRERTAGTSKYPIRKMLAFAFDGITSFSVLPLRFLSFVGGLVFALSVLLSVWAFIPVFSGEAVHGWASTVIPIFAFAGMQMVSIGLLGEYIGKVYTEVKARPHYIIEEQVNAVEK